MADELENTLREQNLDFPLILKDKKGNRKIADRQLFALLIAAVQALNEKEDKDGNNTCSGD